MTITYSDVAKVIAEMQGADRRIEKRGYTQVLSTEKGYFQWVKNEDVLSRKDGWIAVKPDAKLYDANEIEND